MLISGRILFVYLICFHSVFAVVKNPIKESNEKKIQFKGFADVVEYCLPAVVNISVTGMTEIAVPANEMPLLVPFGPENESNGRVLKKKTASIGSGVFISEDGYILTNYHVVEQAKEIVVTTSDQQDYKAQLIGFDARTDIALLKVIKLNTKMPFLKFANSAKARIGDSIIAIGNPLGLGFSVTSGIISAKSRHNGELAYDDFIQIDAPINKGNSGGPLLDIEGKILGINTSIISTGMSPGNIGIGFAIPADLAVNIVHKIKNNEKIERLWIGLAYRPLTERIALAAGLPGDTQGFVVGDVVPDSPAEKGGIKSGDIILSVNGVLVKKNTYLPQVIFPMSVGAKLGLKIFRYGKKIDTTLYVAAKPEDKLEILDKTNKNNTSSKDVLIAEIGPKIRNQFKIPQDINGVLVIDIPANIIKIDEVLKIGDVVTNVNDKTISSLQDFESSFLEAKRSGAKFINMRIFRRGVTFLDAVQIKE